MAESDLPDTARKAFAGEIQDGDVIRPAGYPKGDSRSFQLVRGGDTVGELEYMPDGRWLLGTHDSCT